jgi:hypothetical protein
MLARPSLTGEALSVIAILRAGELLQFLESTEVIELVNPLGSGVDSSGTWYKVRISAVGEGWVFVKPNAHDGPSFATLIAIASKTTASQPQNTYSFGSLLIVVLIIVAALAFTRFVAKTDSARAARHSEVNDGIDYVLSTESSKEVGTGKEAPADARRQVGWPGAWSSNRDKFFGGRYTQHVNKDKTKPGYSEYREKVFGGFYQQHYTQDEKKAGYSETHEKLFGGKYTQHHDHDGKKTGYSEKQEGFFGGEYVQHYKQDGSKDGYSERKEDFWGNEYWQHYDQDGTKRKE